MNKFPIEFIDIGDHKEIDVWTDGHEDSEMEIKVDWTYKQNKIMLGDNIDISRMKKSDVKKGREKERKMKERFGLQYFEGNHSRARDIDVYRKLLRFPHISLGHGDSIAKGFEWSQNYRFGEAGASWAKRKIWTNFLEGIQQNWGGTLNIKELEIARQIAKYMKSPVLLIGHLHPEKHLDYDYRDIYVGCFKRGETKNFDLTQFDHYKYSSLWGQLP